MHLTVKDEAESVVAEVEVDPAYPFHRTEDGFVVGHVIGQFVPGNGFARIRMMLDAFEAAYNAGDEQSAVALHDAIDKLGMSATDDEGVRYRVFCVYFQQGALLFAVAKP